MGGLDKTTSRTALTWRVIHDSPLAGSRNMSIDHALAASSAQAAEAGNAAVLRLYSWSRPTVSFGKNEPARDLYLAGASGTLDIDYVRRPTGGRVVLHDAEVTYAVIAPAQALGGARAAYKKINQALSSALTSLGATVSMSGDHTDRDEPATDAAQPADASVTTPPLLPLDAGPCFQSPAPGEVVANGGKLVGSAQAKIGPNLLQHGSIILLGDQSRLTQLRGDGVQHPGPTALADLVDGVDARDVELAVAESMRVTFGGRWTQSTYTREELDTADRLEAERYGNDDWTWRR